MQLFYIPGLESDKYILSFEESKHCIKVLRLKKGDVVYLTDGKGNLYKTQITIPDPKKCEVQILESFSEYGKKEFYLHLAIAPTKNIKRTEWFLEKCTEIGVDEFTFIDCRFSERSIIKQDRFQRVVIAALKQSTKAYLPKINGLVNFNDFIGKNIKGKKYIAICDEQRKSHLKDLYCKGENATILIGPEGDYSEEEKELALKNSFQPVSLGESRLRTETAGIVACHTINLINEK